jgi:hypothetical protein
LFTLNKTPNKNLNKTNIMFTSIKTKIISNNFTKIFIVTLTLASLVFILQSTRNLTSSNNKSAQAATPNTANLIVGTKDTGTAVELTVCLQATDGPIHIANSSAWFSYDSAALTPNSTILEKGQYGNATNGYGLLKWQEVLGSTTPAYSLNLGYNSDFGTGSLMTTTPELFAKVSFNKVSGATASTAITVVNNKNVFYSTENLLTPIVQTISNVVGDCRGSVAVTSSSSSTSSLSVSSSVANSPVAVSSSSSTIFSNSTAALSSSSSQSQLISSSSSVANSPVAVSSSSVILASLGIPNIPAGTGLGGTLGGQFPIIPLINCTYPNGTVATFTPPGSTSPITGTIINGSFVPNPGQTIPNNAATGLLSGVLTVNGTNLNIPTNFAALGSPTIGTIGLNNPPIILIAGGQFPIIPLINCTYPNGTVATFTPPGSTSPITGTIINGSFVPNPGQTIPINSVYGAGVGILVAGGQVVAIPVSVAVANSLSGGVITIGGVTNASSSSTQVSPNVSTDIAPKIQIANNSINSNGGVFKSKLKITDPYVCGEGSYGNVPNPKEFGVEAVYYDFYKAGSSVPSYSFKLKLASNGDFFLPITKTENPISEGDYRVVFYAFDNEGNKAQGEYTDFITTNCISGRLLNSSLYQSVRTGGFSTLTSLIAILLTLSSLYFYQKSKTKKKIDYDFENKID